MIHGQQKKAPGESFAVLRGTKGGQDLFGPYDTVPNWPKPLFESLPSHEGWTWSQSPCVFLESPDRVLVAQKGELPVPSCPAQNHLASGDRAWHQVSRRSGRNRQYYSSGGKAAPGGGTGRPGIDLALGARLASSGRSGTDEIRIHESQG